MKRITKDLNLLKENDILNIILYGLYKLTNEPQYAAISELAYTLDKDNLMKLCSTFGGTTIKVPTLNELETLTKALLMIQYMFEGKSYGDSISALELDPVADKDVLNMYDILIDTVEAFNE